MIMAPAPQPIVVDGKTFTLNGKGVSYRFRVNEETGELEADHYGGPITEAPIDLQVRKREGWSTKGLHRYEFPDSGRGDFRVPAFIVEHSEGYTVTALRYQSHDVIKGKPELGFLPSTFGKEAEVQTLVIHMYDEVTDVAADLTYSIFPAHDAIARGVKITNKGKGKIVINKLSSFSVDLPYAKYEMIGLHGEWTRERVPCRRPVEYGSQGFGSYTGFSSHHHNPFLSMVTPKTTEDHGEAWGFSLVYTGSFKAEVEKSPQGLHRVSMGMHQDQLSWPLQPGESLTTPECVGVYSNTGLGGMSRKFHRLYRNHLIKSPFGKKPRPTLLNCWEGVYFNFDENTVQKLAEATADLGFKLFVLDDGWFGNKYPRNNDHAGLGDWDTNKTKFPNGLKTAVEKACDLKIADSDEKLQFGLWIEPEMVNPKSELYEKHPDWVLHAGKHVRTEGRQQLVLNLALPEVQEWIINEVSDILSRGPITYIKWDHNRGTHESPTPANHHAYQIGMYKVFEALTSKFPEVLWEGCASGGARFDPGLLQYFPQVWTSDSMDAQDRLHMQFGTSMVYPASTMGAHIGCNPNHVTGRSTPMEFRAHVAMMGGSFGMELDPAEMPEEDKKVVPGLIALAERANPIVVNGDMWRLSAPDESQHPAVLFISEDGKQAVLFAYQMCHTTVYAKPVIYLRGLDAEAKYKLDGDKVYSGATLMNGGMRFDYKQDWESKVVFIEKV